jgi:hypothetical protein
MGLILLYPVGDIVASDILLDLILHLFIFFSGSQYIILCSGFINIPLLQ